MKINKKEILSSLKADLQAAETLRRDIDAKIQQWKNEHDGLPYGNEEDGKSSIVSRDIKKQSAWQHASIIDPFVSTPNILRAYPVTFEDQKSARQNELLMNTYFCRKFNRYGFMTKFIKVLDREGTAVIQTAWDYKEEIVEEEVEVIKVDEEGYEYIDIDVEEVVKVVKNQPTAKVCRNEDIYIDPTCMDDMDNCQFVIHRYETDMSTLKQDGRYKNLDKVVKVDTDYDYESEDDTNFTFKDDPRRKLVIYEYWGNYDVDGDGIAEPIVCSWIDNVIVRLQENPYPDKKPPFVVVPFSSVPFQMHGEANAELIGDNQKVKTAIVRGMIDNFANSNNSQVGVRRGSLDSANLKLWKDGENFQFSGNPTTDFWQGSYNQLPGSAFDMLGLMNNEIESITGVKSFSGGITGASLGSSATAAKGVMDAASVRKIDIVRNIAENGMKPLFRKWIAYAAEFASEEEVIRITNEEFEPIRKDDLGGQIDIQLEIATREEDQARAQELAFMLQTMGNSIPFELTQKIWAKQAKLSRMPDLENEIATFQPKPDPIQEKIKELELQNMILENKKLMAEIERDGARAAEDRIDAQLKSNKAAVEAAKARKLMSEADLADLKHIKEDAGYAHLEKMELADQKHMQDMNKQELEAKYNMLLAKFQAINNDKNIGLMRN